MAIDFALEEEQITLFVRSLNFLPNLHTLEIAWFREKHTHKLRKVLRNVQLPQIKTLILSVNAHPLLEHCLEVEDVVCVPKQDAGLGLEAFLKSIAFNQYSKVRKLAIPLTLRWGEDKPFRK